MEWESERRKTNKIQRKRKEEHWIGIKIICWWCRSTWNLCMFVFFSLLILPPSEVWEEKKTTPTISVVLISCIAGSLNRRKIFLQHYAAMILSPAHILCHCCCSFLFRWLFFRLLLLDLSAFFFLRLDLASSLLFGTFDCFDFIPYLGENQFYFPFFAFFYFDVIIHFLSQFRIYRENVYIACTVTQCYHAALLLS